MKPVLTLFDFPVCSLLVTRHCRKAAWGSQGANFTAGGRELFASRSKEAGNSVLVKMERSFTRSFVTSSIMCGPHFCSMRITEDVRKFAAEQGISENEALEKGLKEKAKEFAEKGADVYTTA